MRNITTPDDAARAMREALDTHGMPLALCHVPIRVRNLVPPAALRSMLDHYRNQQPVAPANPDQARDQMTKWCDQHPYHIITTRELAEAVGCSQHTVRKFIADQPHYFKRINQYKYEVRNFRDDRAHDKARTA